MANLKNHSKSNSMMYNIEITGHFKKQLKKLVKKDPELKINLIKTLNNFSKEHSISLGKGVYKFRMKRSGAGKSGGYRLLVYTIEYMKLLSPIYIYSKVKQTNITFEELSRHLEIVKTELENM